VNYKDGVLYFEIRDKTDSIYTFSERSSGLRFFLSYYIQAKAMERTSRNHNAIVLMDEPDSALSIVGQRNLLAVFESLVSPESSDQTCQLIYTTHSPYLINRNFPRRLRVVKKEDAEQGTQYIEQARARRYEPVRTALGIDSAPRLFLGSDNILTEGPTDQYLLTELIRVFATPQNVGEFLDLNALEVVSADGVGNIENVLDQSHWADEPIPPTLSW
jgi:predicted ATP-dependent endonuclease of OLD family